MLAKIINENKNKNKIYEEVGCVNYQNRLAGWPGISSSLLPRTLNFPKMNSDLGAISNTNKDEFLPPRP